jgi:hypothetical protein
MTARMKSDITFHGDIGDPIHEVDNDGDEAAVAVDCGGDTLVVGARVRCWGDACEDLSCDENADFYGYVDQVSYPDCRCRRCGVHVGVHREDGRTGGGDNGSWIVGSILCEVTESTTELTPEGEAHTVVLEDERTEDQKVIAAFKSKHI